MASKESSAPFDAILPCLFYEFAYKAFCFIKITFRIIQAGIAVATAHADTMKCDLSLRVHRHNIFDPLLHVRSVRLAHDVLTNIIYT